MENGEEDFIRGEEDGAATWRIGARLNQQPSTFNPLQEVYKYVQLFWSNFVPGTVNRGAFLSFPHRLSGRYDFVDRRRWNFNPVIRVRVRPGITKRQ